MIGLLGVPWYRRFANFLNPEEALEMMKMFSWGEFLPLAGASVAISSLGITLAVFAYYLNRFELGKLLSTRFPRINSFFVNKWYLDAINEKIFVQSEVNVGSEFSFTLTRTSFNELKGV